LISVSTRETPFFYISVQRLVACKKMPPKPSQPYYEPANIELTAPSAYSINNHEHATEHSIDLEDERLGRKKTNVIVKVGRGIEKGAKKTGTAVVSVWEDFSNFVKRGNVVCINNTAQFLNTPYPCHSLFPSSLYQFPMLFHALPSI
jgi:hypothetical protein